MNWTDKYLPPLVERDKFSFNKVKSIIKDFKELMIHALSFHKQPQKPSHELPIFKDEDTDIAYNIYKEFYSNANDRIDKLEDKAIKLLSYISALFAFISFSFVNTQFVFTKIMLILSMFSLVLAIVISFRCVNVKGRKLFFIPDVYNFESKAPKPNFDKKVIAKKLLNSAIYNQNVADNTADILKAARYALVVAIVISMIGFLAGSFSYFKSPSKTTAVRIENQIDLSQIKDKLDSTNKNISELNSNIKMLDDNKKMQEQINTLTEELQKYKSNYESLSKRLEEVEKNSNNK